MSVTATATRNYGCAGAFLTNLALSAPTFPRSTPQQALLTDPTSRTYPVKLRKRTMTITLTGEAPGWLDPTIQTMQRLAHLPGNWSSYGNCLIEDIAIIRAAEVLAEVLDADGLAPSIVPTSQGGVQLEWHRNGDDVEIEFSPQGTVSDVYIYDRRTERAWQPDRVTSETFERLKTTINSLAQR
jgi:hypothetical protein